VASSFALLTSGNRERAVLTTVSWPWTRFSIMFFAAGISLSSLRGLRSNDVKNHDKKITCCFYLKKAETFLLLMFFNFSP
jgi:hypothetical protein